MWMGAVEKVTEDLHLNYTLLAVLRFLKFGKHQPFELFLFFFFNLFILNSVTVKILLICCCHFESSKDCFDNCLLYI